MANDLVEIKPGDYVVTRSRYDWLNIYLVSRVMPQTFYYENEYRSRETRTDRKAVIFAGAKDIAEKLKDRLTSSLEQERQEKTAAREQRMARDAVFLAQAKEGR